MKSASHGWWALGRGRASLRGGFYRSRRAGEASEQSAGSNGKLKVLLVEDSEDDAFFLERELRRGGYDPECERVYTAEAMREALGRGGWDIVISDHSMPAFNSSGALEVLGEAGWSDVPFIIVSGKIGEDAAVAAMRSGANDYVMKDNLARLNTAIERELREAENRREKRRADEELARSEERYRTFVSQSTEGIWRAEVEVPLDVTLSEEAQLDHLYEHFVFAEANDAMARMYGFERAEDLLGLRLGRLLSREVPENLAYLRGAIRSGYRVTDAESQETDLQGNPRYFLSNFVGIIEGGKLVRVWGTQRDVTERKKAAEALEEAEEKYRSIFENAVEGIFQTSVDGRFLTANPAMARMLGYDSPDDLLARITNIPEQLYVDSERREEFGRFIERFGEVSGFETEMRRKGGGTVWVSISGRALEGSDGEVLGYEGTLEDISARREAEEALRQSEALYRSVVENAAENIFIVDVQSRRILEANDALGRSLGYSAGQLKEMTLYDLVANERASIEASITRVLEAGHLRLGERLYRKSDGTLANVEVGASVIPYGNRAAMCVVAHDVTDRKRAEEALGEIREAERRRISRDLHDSVLQDLTFTFQSMQIERKIHGGRRREEGRQIEALRRAVGGIRDAIYDLRLEGVGAARSLTRSLEALVELNRQLVPERPVGFYVGEGFPENIRGDATVEVARIVQEALSNVRRHSGASRVNVSLRAAGGEAVVEVEDDGRGFEQTGKTGVGLESMRERAGKIGASLEVESGRAAGTRITLKAPLVALAKEGPEESRPDPEV